MASAKMYTAVDLGMLGGIYGRAFAINPRAKWWEEARQQTGQPTRFCGRTGL